MTPETWEKVRKLRGKLCSLAEEYKGVAPEHCRKCESPCQYGISLLEALGMDKPAMDSERREAFGQDRRVRKIIRAINRRWRR